MSQTDNASAAAALLSFMGNTNPSTTFAGENRIHQTEVLVTTAAGAPLLHASDLMGFPARAPPTADTRAPTPSVGVLASANSMGPEPHHAVLSENPVMPPRTPAGRPVLANISNANTTSTGQEPAPKKTKKTGVSTPINPINPPGQAPTRSMSAPRSAPAASSLALYSKWETVIKVRSRSDLEEYIDTLLEDLKKEAKIWRVVLVEEDDGALKLVARFRLTEKRFRDEDKVTGLFGSDSATPLPGRDDVLDFNLRDVSIKRAWCDEANPVKEVVDGACAGHGGVNATSAMQAGKFVTRQLSAFLRCEMYPWQKQVMIMAQEQEDRKIRVIVDRRGKSGKSIFAEYMEHRGIALDMPIFRSREEILQWAQGFPPMACYLVDMPRGMKKGGTATADFYAGLEMLKNGRTYDKRYQPKCRRMDRPQVIVFTNKMPEWSLMSRDRWEVWEMSSTLSLKFYAVPDCTDGEFSEEENDWGAV